MQQEICSTEVEETEVEEKDYGSLVRNNLMRQLGYTPYCGREGKCFKRWPRTTFINGQFRCPCGWASQYEDSFIQEWKTKWSIK